MVARTRKSPVKPAQKEAGKPRAGAAKAADTRSLDRVREILIGSHAGEVEKRFRSIEKRLDEGLAKVEEETKRLDRQSEDLSQEFRRRTEELAEALHRAILKLGEEKADRAALADVLALVADRLRKDGREDDGS
ncbi:MAG: hypothetical protein JXP34_04205 [Planctomycetes bacterium]|nr:hypothetical protein [Planctomycetota bacterium]